MQGATEEREDRRNSGKSEKSVPLYAVVTGIFSAKVRPKRVTID